MKQIITLCCSIIMIGILSCTKTKDAVNEATEFDINYTTSFNIPSTGKISVSTPAEFTTPDIPTQSSTRFASEKTTQDLIEEIKMTRFNISNPKGNLDFLDSLSIFIKSTGKPDVLVATKSKIPKGISSLSADLKDVNIKEYIFKDKIQFKVSAKITSGLTTEQSLKLDQTVRVKGKRVK